MNRIELKNYLVRNYRNSPGDFTTAADTLVRIHDLFVNVFIKYYVMQLAKTVGFGK